MLHKVNKIKSGYTANKQNIILFMIEKNKLNKADVCRRLNIVHVTLQAWIDDPSLIRLRDLNTFAGMFGITVETLVYCLHRSQPQLAPRDKSDKWYIEEQILAGEKLLKNFAG